MILHISGLTDKGLQRDRNEDAFLIMPLSSGSEGSESVTSDVTPYLIVVTDGLGGHAGGETASEIICNVFESYANRLIQENRASGFSEEDAASFLKSAAEAAHAEIKGTAEANPALLGMGAVCTSGILLNNSLIIAHTGDTRCFILREKTLTRLTRDHTQIETLLRSGRITPAEARKHPLRHIVTNALGYGPSPRIDLTPVTLQKGDRVLFCSDGLTEMLNHAEIISIMNFYKDSKSCAASLIEGALKAGGADNITAVVADLF